ncbi:MAG: LETM1-related biofilm-associated protein [Flavobacteriaceae bacterium]|nr:LETM1-related biofilm-associated protein [Flavobacteriaceae bacterium]MDG2350656.1 LETM1-related biofilm-associated protein [Flavobacteriaceae bacterium]|tara:strand:+ start:663 stop:1835 length:1173 start_codon:yes stop_codon:yes gene_type:complete
MNPSARGWIAKLLNILSDDQELLNQSEQSFYENLRTTGFIYGNNKNTVANFIDSKQLSDDEICKINLFLSLYFTHNNSNSNIPFLESIITFYKNINVYKFSFFNFIFNSKEDYSLLEKILHKRIQIDDNILIKNFNYFVINALLYVDILAYKEFLLHNSISLSYIQNLEASIEKNVLEVLNSKINKTTYDQSLITLLKLSMRFQNNAHISQKEAVKNIVTLNEKWYLFDIACMATWSDRVIDKKERHFLVDLGSKLHLPKTTIKRSINSVNTFYSINKNNIDLLSSRNIVENFYTNSSKLVNKLVSRNKTRLQKEFRQSKELMILISQSTVRDLTRDETKRLQEQLLDIIKTIPSLAIFLLPGGALLLPLFIKIIPKLLPSAFDDNRIEK